jgi:hypothetical protein
MAKDVYMNDDMVIACADLVGRAGATKFEIGHLHDDVPIERAGWYATAFYRGTRVSCDNQPSPTAAAHGLSEQLLAGATCRCGQSDHREGCRWRLIGPRWEPSCDAPPMKVPRDKHGDPVAMAAIADNRAMRRARDRKKA